VGAILKTKSENLRFLP